MNYIIARIKTCIKNLNKAIYNRFLTLDNNLENKNNNYYNYTNIYLKSMNFIKFIKFVIYNKKNYYFLNFPIFVKTLKK